MLVTLCYHDSTMSATPKLNALSVASTTQVAVVVTGRRTQAQQSSPAIELAAGLGRHVVVRGHGRRSGAGERLVAELLDAGVSTVVVPALTSLHPSAAKALGIAGALLMAGVRVVSLADGWLAFAEAETLVAVATHLQAEEHRKASVLGRRSIGLVRRGGGRVGRPPKPLTVPVEVARDCASDLGWRLGARKAGTSAASLRRALDRAGLLPISPTSTTP